jgi:acetyl-CoA carboxylase beta subunit
VSKEANIKKPSNKTDANKGSGSGSSPTFWTNCPHCKYRFQYIKKVLNCLFVCPTCNKKFTAYRVEELEPPIPEHDWKRNNGSQNVPKEANKKKPLEPMHDHFIKRD